MPNHRGIRAGRTAVTTAAAVAATILALLAVNASPVGAVTVATTRPTTVPAISVATRPSTGPSTRPVNPRVRRVLIISVDGLRPDLLLRAHTPTMHGLFESGSYSFWAKTVPVSITLPSHTSMITGVNPRRHEIEWNRDLPTTKPIYPNFPTLLNLARRAGYTTAIVAGKSKFAALAEPGSVDVWSMPDAKTKTWKDEQVAAAAIEVIRRHRPAVFYLHFPGADVAGHAKGWGSKEQIAAIEKIDALLGEVMVELSERRLMGSTVIILSADHGGAGLTHGPEDARSRHIPWIIRGPGIAVGRDLTTYEELEVRTEDTFGTACHLLGLRPTTRSDGRPVREAYADYKAPKKPATGFRDELYAAPPLPGARPSPDESTELLRGAND